MSDLQFQDRSIDLTHVGGIIFDEASHTYKNANGEKYTGITTLLGNYHEHFDEEAVSINKAIKDCIIDHHGQKKYNYIKNNLNGDRKLDDMFSNMPSFMKNKIFNYSIKTAVLEDKGEDNYLKLEKQVKGEGNLVKSLSAIKNQKQDLYNKIIDIAKRQYAIETLGNENYKDLKNRFGGFENIYLYLKDLESENSSLFDRVHNKKKELIQEWRDINKRATDLGSDEHDRREQKIYDDGGFYWDGVFYEYKKGKHIMNVTSDEVIVIPECMVWNHEMKLGGLADIFLFYKGTIYVVDYKTNASIDTKPAIKNKKYWKYMFGPCSSLLDLNFYHYSLQLKIYQKMAAMLRPDFKMGDNNTLIHTASKEYYRDKDVFIPCCEVESIVDEIFKELKFKNK